MEEKIYFKEALKSLLNEYSQNPNPEDIPLLEYIKQCLKGSDILMEKLCEGLCKKLKTERL